MKPTAMETKNPPREPPAIERPRAPQIPAMTRRMTSPVSVRVMNGVGCKSHAQREAGRRDGTTRRASPWRFGDVRRGCPGRRHFALLSSMGNTLSHRVGHLDLSRRARIGGAPSV
jgi:hypothetical protein